MDAQETIGKPFESLDPSICAVLVKIHGTVGAVRVFSDMVINVVAGPENGTEFVIVTIKRDEETTILGTPSMRHFRRPSS